MKKLSGQDGSDWYCETCAQSVPEPDWRYIMDMRLQDHTDAHYTTAFRSAEEIIGIPARDLHNLDKIQQDKLIDNVFYKTRLFVLKAHIDNWQGDQRLRVSVVRQEPMLYDVEAKRLLDEIDEYSQIPDAMPPGQTSPPRTQISYVPRTPANQKTGAFGFPGY